MNSQRDSFAGQHPPLLYRYRPLQDLETGRLAETVVHSRLYAASPGDFNDPFDSQVRFSYTENSGKWRNYFEHLVRLQYPDWPWKKRRKAAAAMMAQGAWRDPAARDSVMADMQANINQCGVLCLSERADVPLMWSHYASGHRGFCLGFEPVQGSIFARALPIEYRSEWPVPGFLDPAEEQMLSTLFVKADWWCYEKEWRIVDYRGKPGIKSFPPGALKTVIVGCRADEGARQAVRKMVEEREGAIDLQEATVADKSYDLSLVPLLGRSGSPGEVPAE